MARGTALLVFALLLGGAWCLGQSASGTPSAAKSDTEIQAEAAQANDLLQKQNFVGALPLYEDLHAQRPQSLVYQERLALSLIAYAAQQSENQSEATLERARKLLTDAQKAGDNSNLVQILLEHLQPQTAAAQPPEPGQEWIDQGEKAFTSGDLEGALADYKKALEVNPNLYAAALFAGDAEYKLGHLDEAGFWFAKAIAIDPNVETAYRYWGDTLEKAGEHREAEDEFIKAVIAEPYLRSPRIGLQQWARANHARLMAPPIRLPAGVQVTIKDGSKPTVTITVPPKDVPVTPETSVALAYSMESSLWKGDKFHRVFPAEHDYRHSLPEEADGIRSMLAVAKEQKLPEGQLSTSVNLLRELDEKGMLECWILLEDADQGIAQDYATFRESHRELLEKYIEEYEVHPQ